MEEEAILEFDRFIYGKQLKKDDLVDIGCCIIAGYNKEKRKNEIIIKYLKDRIKSVDKCYEELLTDIGNEIKVINITDLSKKEKEEVINNRNCLLVQKHCYNEILEFIERM